MIKRIVVPVATLALTAGLVSAAPAQAARDGANGAHPAATGPQNQLNLTVSDWHDLRAKAAYSPKKHRILVVNTQRKRRKAVAVYKPKRSTSWRKAERCWAPNSKKASTCKVKHIRENKKVRWRLCAGLYAKKRRNQKINFGPKWCTASVYFRK